jgi:multiple sugar transport system substrate-binding protein
MEKKRAAMMAASVAIALGVASFTTACESASDDNASPGSSADASAFSGAATGTLSAWAFDNPDDVGQARLDYAKQKLAGVTIKMDETTFDAQKFTTRLASGNVPDVVQMKSEDVATYAAQGLIKPLNSCFSANNVDAGSRWYSNVVGGVTYKNQIWAVPQFYQPPAIITNTKVMSSAGVTAADIDTSKPDALLAAIAKMYKAAGGVPTVLGFDPQATGQQYLWVVGLGGQLSDANGVPTLDNPANVYPLQLLKQITDAQGGYAKYKSFTDSFDFFGDKNQYVKGQVGAEINYQWYPNVLSPYTGKVGLGAVPFKGKDGQPVTVATDTAFVVPAKAKNPAAACKWALALTDDAAWASAGKVRAATLAKTNSPNTGLFTGQPAADKANKDEYVKATGNAGFDQVIQTYYDILGNGKSIGSSPAGAQIAQELTNAITAALLGTKTPQKALADAQAAAMASYKTVTGS